MASRQCEFASVFLWSSVDGSQEIKVLGKPTQLAAISKRLATVFARIWLVASMAALMAI